MFLSRSGSDLLSHVLRRSTISATVLNGRVRDGIGCFTRAMTTRPRKKHLWADCPVCLWRCVAIDVFRFRATVSLSFHDGFWPFVLIRLVPGQVFRRFGVTSFPVLSLLDQIKPIGQLVPVN